ncbi:MAG: hypothetical protein ABS939_14250 [Psychrobacillus sp.]
MYNLLFVDVGNGKKFPTYIHKINVINGDHVRGQMLKGDMRNQIDALIDMLISDRPDKIIFDKTGIGIYFYEQFMIIVYLHYKNTLSVDAFGLITYYDT